MTFSRLLPPLVLGAILLGSATPAAGQILVPDRLPNGQRMSVLTTSADRGTLAYDTVRTLPIEDGGRDTWWHRHALFTDGPVRVAMDPVVEYAREWRRLDGADNDSPAESGFRNIRGVRYRGALDGTLHFGGTVLEMQRVLVGPDSEYVLAAQGYPGMGPGKLRPAGNGLFGIDHSIAEVWFDIQASDRVRLQWGLGTVGMGPGTRNLLWNPDMAPAPYLLLDVDLGRGWQYRWYQSRQRSRTRLPADGAREGRYAPLGLSVRSLGKTLTTGEHTLHVNWVTATWMDVLKRGQARSPATDWAVALAPWSSPLHRDTANAAVLTGHHGIDLQWRRTRSTWYGQVRFAPWLGHNPAEVDPATWLIGHVRHGDQWSVWTEFTPAKSSALPNLDPASSGGNLGIRLLSDLQPDWVQGIEWRPAGMTIAAEWGRLRNASSWKMTLSLPPISADSAPHTKKVARKKRWPNRHFPALVPCTPFINVMKLSNDKGVWWSLGLFSHFINSRKSH